MGLVMIEDRGLICPQIFCDICGNRIEDASNGLIEYGARQNKTELILFVHNPGCEMSGKRWERIMGQPMAWRPLDDFLRQLCHSENVRTSFALPT